MSGDRFKSLSVEDVRSIDMPTWWMKGDRYVVKLNYVAGAVKKWQRETFGEPATRSGCTARIEHLRREVVEATVASRLLDIVVSVPVTAQGSVEEVMAILTACPELTRDDLASELADIFILLQSAVDEAGMDLATIVYRKLCVNRGRTWKAADSAGVIEHVETEDD